MEFLLLGPVEVRADGRPMAIGGSKQRALLAMLLLDSGQVVSSDRLIEGLWGDDPPATASKMLQVLVSRLRAALGDGAAEQVIATQAPGYVAGPAADQLDLARFQQLVRKGRATLSDNPAAAASTLRSALELWRGPPLSDVAGLPFAQLAIPWLEEIRLSALEDRIDADLAVGGNGELVAELRAQVTRTPLRERPRAQLMLALYRQGRQAEALDTYREARTTLAEELGLEPSAELQRLETAILRQDPSLDATPERGWIAGVLGPDPGLDGADASLDAGTVDDHGGVRPERRGGWGLRIGIAAGILGAVIILVAALGGQDRSHASAVHVRANSVAAVDPATGVVVSDTPAGTSPGPIAVAGGDLWVGNIGDQTVERIDPNTRTTVKTFGLSSFPASLTAGDGLVWVGDGWQGTLSRIIVAYDQLSSPFSPIEPVPGQLGVATSPGVLWVGLPDHRLVQLNAANFRSEGIFPLPYRPLAVTVSGRVAWAIPFPSQGSSVTRLVPGARPVSATIPIPGHPQTIASGDGNVWVGTSDGRLWKVDPDRGAIVSSIATGLSAAAIAVGPGAVWVAGGPNGTLERIDPNRDTVTMTIQIGHPIGGIAIADGEVWLTLD